MTKPKTEAQLDRAASRRIEEAWKSRAYEALTEVESRYLAALIRGGSHERARLAVGMKIYKQEELIRKLDDAGLISYSRRMIPDDEDAAEILKAFPVRKLLPVIPSPPAMTIYSFLAARYVNVFPELSLASFLNLDEMGDLLADKQDRWYALCCRVDFVVCDVRTVPRFAVEYQGGGHDRVKMQRRDDLKAGLLEAAGIRAYSLRPQDLGNLDEVFEDFPADVEVLDPAPAGA